MTAFGSEAVARRLLLVLRGFRVMILRAREPHCFLCFGMPLKFGPVGGSQVGLGRVRANSRTACYPLGPDELGNGHLIVMLRHSNPPAKSRPAMTAGGSLINSQQAGQEGTLCFGHGCNFHHKFSGVGEKSLRRVSPVVPSDLLHYPNDERHISRRSDANHCLLALIGFMVASFAVIGGSNHVRSSPHKCTARSRISRCVAQPSPSVPVALQRGRGSPNPRLGDLRRRGCPFDATARISILGGSSYRLRVLPSPSATPQHAGTRTSIWPRGRTPSRHIPATPASPAREEVIVPKGFSAACDAGQPELI
jgi:hypothetical protein